MEARPRSDLAPVRWRYRAHDLTIAADAPIPQLIETGEGGEPDLCVRFQADARAADEPLETPWFIGQYRTDAGAPSLSPLGDSDSHTPRPQALAVNHSVRRRLSCLKSRGFPLIVSS